MGDPRWLVLTLPLLGVGACRLGTDGREDPPAARRFAPPPDERLTARQVEMYVAVRRKALEAPSLSFGTPRDLDPARLASVVTAELETARSLGYDSDEYAWVKRKVLEARPSPPAAVPPPLAGAAVSLEGLRGIPDASHEPGANARAERRAEGAPLEGARTPEAARSEARAYNQQLLARYEKELSSLEAAVPLPAARDPAGR